jgi:hypothetical protein
VKRTKPPPEDHLQVNASTRTSPDSETSGQQPYSGLTGCQADLIGHFLTPCLTSSSQQPHSSWEKAIPTVDYQRRGLARGCARGVGDPLRRVRPNLTRIETGTSLASASPRPSPGKSFGLRRQDRAAVHGSVPERRTVVINGSKAQWLSQMDLIRVLAVRSSILSSAIPISVAPHACQPVL